MITDDDLQKLGPNLVQIYATPCTKNLLHAQDLQQQQMLLSKCAHLKYHRNSSSTHLFPGFSFICLLFISSSSSSSYLSFIRHIFTYSPSSHLFDFFSFIRHLFIYSPSFSFFSFSSVEPRQKFAPNIFCSSAINDKLASTSINFQCSAKSSKYIYSASFYIYKFHISIEICVGVFTVCITLTQIWC